MEPPQGIIQVSPMIASEYPVRKDVVGQAGVFIDDFIQAMKTSQIYNVMGVRPDKSFLITGAPGNGKTMGIEALVNEANKEVVRKTKEGHPPGSVYQDVGLMAFKYDTGRYGTAYINEGSKTVQSFFDICFKVSETLPTLVIFDEAENLFGSRQDHTGHKEDSKVLETIMKNMQKLHDTDDIYAVMMSNFPEAFDAASIRSGRVDKRYEFKKPNQTEREFAYTHAINQINDRAKYKVIRGTDPSELANMSNGFSYSDVAESVSAAVKQKAKEVSSDKNKQLIDLNIWITQKRIKDSVKDHGEKFVGKTKGKIGFT